MTSRNVKDADGRVWVVALENAAAEVARVGQDVILLCKTATVAKTIRLVVSWNWAKMSDKGLARMINAAEG